jgi:hypothetical protein
MRDVLALSVEDMSLEVQALIVAETERAERVRMLGHASSGLLPIPVVAVE